MPSAVSSLAGWRKRLATPADRKWWGERATSRGTRPVADSLAAAGPPPGLVESAVAVELAGVRLEKQRQAS
jgi:hypothetical protein